VHASGFGEALRRQRLASGLTQEELAERAALSVRAISDLERGVKRVPRPSSLRLLVAAMSLSGNDAETLLQAARLGNGAEAQPARNNLPVAISSFVGRERSLAELHARLDTARLLTLTGAGGIGKTRLALEVASQILQRYADGVWLIELANVTDPALVPNSAALTLGVKVRPGRTPLEALRQTLESRHTLLILDNCEHLLNACAELVEVLLKACPRVQVLATSREALGLSGEVAWLVPSLGLDSDAQRLFVERASAINHDLRSAGASKAAVARVCRQVDGIPLAIELAAAWTNVLSLDEIAARLAASPDLLIGPRSAPPRQRTVRLTVDWSLGLLDEAEREVFDQLSVFVGGFTLSASAAVAGRDVLLPLARLVAASLVVREGDRYRLLEPLRQVGQQRLGGTPGADLARARHAAHYLELAESLQTELWGRGARGNGVVMLERDVGNLRAALRWLLDQGDAERAGRLGAVLARFWMYSGRLAEGRAWLAELLPLEGMTLGTRGRLLVASAAAATYELDLGVARTLLEDGLAAAREGGDDWAIAWALFLLAWGAPGRAGADLDSQWLMGLCAEGAARSDASGDAVLQVMLEITGAMLRMLAGDVVGGEAAARDSLRQASAIGAPREVARAQLCLGIAAYLRHELPAAGDWLQAARAAWEVEGEAQQVPWFLVVTGQVLVAADAGDRWLARRCLAGLLGLWSTLDRLPQLGGACVQALVYLLAAEGNWREVLRLGRVLEGQAAPLELVRYFGRRVMDLMPDARAALGTAAAAEAWEGGAKLSLADACQRAESVANQRPARQRLAGGLSAREAEVLRLVADGKTNRQISEVLVLSERTVAKHLDHVFAKLGVSSRAAAAAFAVRSGL
jgi:predicted ATPase/DNA-binding CsgD family transcriptional regulator